MAKVDKVRSARFKLGRSHPYLSTALWAFQLIERDMSEFEIHMFEDSEGEQVRVNGPVADPAAFMEENELVYKGSVVREFAVDERWRIYYDPKGVERYEVDELAFILLHEVHHLIRNHADRARSKQVVPDVWNIAGDMEINDDLK